MISWRNENEKTGGNKGWLLLSLLLALPALRVTTFEQSASAVFELELPGLGVAPTHQPILTIPSNEITQILLHILRPYADSIDYSQIYTFINGEAAASICEVVNSSRGKVVRMHLDWRPGFGLVSGRNSIEVRTQDRRGRVFYASFILQTATENRNETFAYRVELGQQSPQQVPPELVLFEPEREVELRPGGQPQTIRIAGVATAASSIASVSVNGQSLALKRDQQVTLRKLGLANEQNRVAFDTTYRVPTGIKQLVVVASDTSGSRTQLVVPIHERKDIPVMEFRGRKFALIAGVSKFRYPEGGLTNLQYCDADATSIFRFLQTPAGGNFSTDDMLLLTNGQVTLARLREALSSFVSHAGPEDLLLIFLATHGSPDPYAPEKLYFLVHDSHVDRMPETALAMQDFQLLLQKNARVRRLVLLVDACHSAGLTGSQGEMTRGVANNLLNLYVERLLYREEGRAFISSCDVNESSREHARWGGGHGVFTHFLLEGMEGKADSNFDHLVTVGELFRFVRQKVRFETQFRQNPRVLAGTNESLALAAVTSSDQQK
jgi:hypothetical protein